MGHLTLESKKTKRGMKLITQLTFTLEFKSCLRRAREEKRALFGDVLLCCFL